MKPSHETGNSSRSEVTHICGAIVDKDGREVERFCITTSGPSIPAPSATSSDTPSANDGLTQEDLWGTAQPQSPETPSPPGSRD